MSRGLGRDVESCIGSRQHKRLCERSPDNESANERVSSSTQNSFTTLITCWRWMRSRGSVNLHLCDPAPSHYDASTKRIEGAKGIAVSPFLPNFRNFFQFRKNPPSSVISWKHSPVKTIFRKNGRKSQNSPESFRKSILQTVIHGSGKKSNQFLILTLTNSQKF
jgi:hypothetical protein